MFRVETARKYYYAKLYNHYKKEFQNPNNKKTNEEDRAQQLAFLKQKVDEEKEENNQKFTASIGQRVIYGQNIQLRHIYSKTRLTLNNHNLAKQYGCVELALEEHGSEFTNFKFQSSNNLRSNEDVVYYSDSLTLNNAEDPSMYAHVWEERNIPSKLNTCN